MMYLFSWEEVPGNDSERLIEFLMQNFNIEWIKAAKINKTDDVKTIRITNDTNFLSLTLNNEKNNVNLEIDDGRTDKFIVKTENDELNIYYFCILSIYFHGNNSKIRPYDLYYASHPDFQLTFPSSSLLYSSSIKSIYSTTSDLLICVVNAVSSIDNPFLRQKRTRSQSPIYLSAAFGL